MHLEVAILRPETSQLSFQVVSGPTKREQRAHVRLHVRATRSCHLEQIRVDTHVAEHKREPKFTAKQSKFFCPKGCSFLSPQTTSGYCPGALGLFCYFLCEILYSLVDVGRLYYCPPSPRVDTASSAGDLNIPSCIQM